MKFYVFGELTNLISTKDIDIIQNNKRTKVMILKDKYAKHLLKAWVICYNFI